MKITARQSVEGTRLGMWLGAVAFTALLAILSAQTTVAQERSGIGNGDGVSRETNVDSQDNSDHSYLTEYEWRGTQVDHRGGHHHVYDLVVTFRSVENGKFISVYSSTLRSTGPTLISEKAGTITGDVLESVKADSRPIAGSMDVSIGRHHFRWGYKDSILVHATVNGVHVLVGHLLENSRIVSDIKLQGFPLRRKQVTVDPPTDPSAEVAKSEIREPGADPPPKVVEPPKSDPEKNDRPKQTAKSKTAATTIITRWRRPTHLGRHHVRQPKSNRFWTRKIAHIPAKAHARHFSTRRNKVAGTARKTGTPAKIITTKPPKPMEPNGNSIRRAQEAFPISNMTSGIALIVGLMLGAAITRLRYLRR
jgi:hypothetical protein